VNKINVYIIPIKKKSSGETVQPWGFIVLHEITDLSQIIKEQANFYKSLYSIIKILL
jgi:hypothetical protein